jgi:hexosaminidase
MKKLICILVTCLSTLITFSQSTNQIAIIPEPVSLQKTQGQFIAPARISIYTENPEALKQPIEVLRKHFSIAAGLPVSVSTTQKTSTITLQLNKTESSKIGKEGYELSVNPKSITIRANQPAGIFYGVQTLLQLFPKEIEDTVAASSTQWVAPCVEVTDYPRFQWRGLMFDVARHFFTKKQVEQYIDDMVRYKFNLLHMHLTDDEGWRIEIKSLPNLTKVGAWNVKKIGYFGTFAAPAADEPRNFGGYYTQDDIRELVQYAKERFVNILPEVDVPGHSLAAVVSYPDLSCTAGADTYKVRSGEEIMDWSHGAPPIALVDNTLCPANEKVYVFLDKVLTELAQLFPFPYIHMGGDECPKNFWEKSDAIKALMQKEGLKNYEEVQSYFEKRLEKIVESKGKKFMGWDEILEGGLAPSAAVMSWRGMKGGIEAAKMGHEVVMSPTDFAYIDYMQADPIIEPHIYATLRLNKTYQFEPIPEGVNPKYILGGQANLWTEQVYNMRHAEYMTWPRGMAIAESVWSPKEKKNWDDFFRRVEKHFGRLDEAGIKYAPSVYDPIFTATLLPDSSLKVELTTEVKNLDIYYSFDNSFPDRFYPKYTEPLIVPKDAVALKVITYEGTKPVGRMLTMPIDELKRRTSRRR